ncbi:hypothetical protein JCM19241_3252 [Vibrio ishigakensis]|uniref:Uncharacterized protein n=1 Tax=Vibrio ishigakensis TaxID=1481914 RepID=A0A0B8Q6Q8_9VIBR|nr:hypothetical protein JCM19241_3252 [Vibrio ishigakensis]
MPIDLTAVNIRMSVEVRGLYLVDGSMSAQRLKSAFPMPPPAPIKTIRIFFPLYLSRNR